MKVLWKNGIYAENGMGCTGPVLMVNEGKVENAISILAKEGYISNESNICFKDSKPQGKLGVFL